MPCVMALGSGGSGQLGIGRIEDALGVATACTFDLLPNPASKPVNVVGGGNHSLMLFDDGSLYAAGDNSSGACGHNLHGKLLSFHKIVIPGVSGFRSIAATWSASTLVTTDERVFVCGEGARGELGLGCHVAKSSDPVKMDGFPPPGHSIVQMSACFRHVAAVLREHVSGRHSLWGWGAGRHGELGLDAQQMPGGIVWQPVMIKFSSSKQTKEPFEPEQVVCGRDFSYILGSADSSGRKILEGELLGVARHSIASSIPLVIPGHVLLYGTWSSVYLHLPDTGRVVVYGRDRKGPIANEAFPNMSTLRTGSEHAIAKLQDGRVVACGWNEHLNCGESYMQSSPGASLYSVLDSSYQSYPLGCGCATTFFVKVGPKDKYPATPSIIETLSG